MRWYHYVGLAFGLAAAAKSNAQPPTPEAHPTKPGYVCLTQEDFENFCLPRPAPATPPKSGTPKPELPKRPKVPPTSKRCDDYFMNNTTTTGYVGVCVTDPSTLTKESDLEVTLGPPGLCAAPMQCVGLRVKPQTPERVVERVEVPTPIPDPETLRRIGELEDLIRKGIDQPSQPLVNLTIIRHALELYLHGSELGGGTFDIGASYRVTLLPSVWLRAAGGYARVGKNETSSSTTSDGIVHDLTEGVQQVVNKDSTRTLFEDNDRGYVETDLSALAIGNPDDTFTMPLAVGFKAVLYKVGEKLSETATSSLMQNGQQTVAPETADTTTPLEKQLTADLCGYLALRPTVTFGDIVVGADLRVQVCRALDFGRTEVGGSYGGFVGYKFPTR